MKKIFSELVAHCYAKRPHEWKHEKDTNAAKPAKVLRIEVSPGPEYIGLVIVKDSKEYNGKFYFPNYQHGVLHRGYHTVCYKGEKAFKR